MKNIFFDDWQSLLRAAIITVSAYAALIIMLRISGKRTLSKMNAFDFIVTIALGSCLASVSTSKDIALAEGLLVFFLFIALQFMITWLSVRYKGVKSVVSGQPALLLYKGELLKAVMKKERITLEELFVAARIKGAADLKNIDIIVLETTGDITVVENMNTQDAQTLENVKYFPGKPFTG